MSIRAKFYVQRVTETYYTDFKTDQRTKYGENVFATAVYAPDEVTNPENHGYWKSSPSGQFQIQIDNPLAWGELAEGDEFYMDITVAPKRQV